MDHRHALITGDDQGITLLERSFKAYARVPAVAATGRFAGTILRFRLVLRQGRVVAEDFRSPDALPVVRRAGGPTFERALLRPCWHVLPETDSNAIDDIGLPFLWEPRMAVMRARHAASTWLVPARVTGRDGTSGVVTYVIDDASFLLRSLYATVKGVRLTETIRVLHRAPRLPVPKPRC